MRKLILLALISTACTNTVKSDLSPTLIVALRGDVYVLRQGAMLKAEAGMILATNDIIKTGNNAFAQISFNNSSLTAGNETLLSLGTNNKGIATRIIGGDVVFKIEKVASEDYIIQTPTNQFKVRGTEFAIRVTDEQTTLAVTRGAVELFNVDGGASLALVSPRRQLTVDKDGTIVYEQLIFTEQELYIDNLNNARFDAQVEVAKRGVGSNTERRIDLLHEKIERLTDELNEQKRLLIEERREALRYKSQAEAAIAQWQSERRLVDRYKILLEDAGIEYPVIE